MLNKGRYGWLGRVKMKRNRESPPTAATPVHFSTTACHSVTFASSFANSPLNKEENEDFDQGKSAAHTKHFVFSFSGDFEQSEAQVNDSWTKRKQRHDLLCLSLAERKARTLRLLHTTFEVVCQHGQHP